MRPKNLIAGYTPTAGDADRQDFAEQIRRCQSCPHRVRNNCRLANQPCPLIARKPKLTCPLDRPPKIEHRTPNTAAPYVPADYRPIHKIAAVTCHYNPCGYRRLEQNYHRFRRALPPELDLWTVELAYDDAPFRLSTDHRVLRIRGDSARHTLWQKERLINLAIADLPPEYDAIAWLDADLIWCNSDWLDSAREKLAQAQAVQLYEHVIETDAAGRRGTIPPGHVHAQIQGLGYGRPGAAWAARREILAGGLYDRHVIGGGDAALVSAWEGRELPRSIEMATPWADHFTRWAEGRDHRSLDCVPGDAVHLYHGSRTNRRYVDRYRCLNDHRYDPAKDVEIDPETGLLQWTEHSRQSKPEMIRAVADYFQSRREDD